MVKLLIIAFPILANGLVALGIKFWPKRKKKGEGNGKDPA